MDFLRENLIICFGSPMIDITARVPDEFLQKYKLKPNNATSYDENCFKIFDDLKKYNPTYTVGGSITHAVKAIQKSLGFPKVCCYLGAIGDDEFGKNVKETLIDEGTNVFFEEIAGESTSKCAVLLLEDNRSFVTDLGASRFFTEAFMEIDDVKNSICQGKYYYMSAFFFRVSYRILQKICSYTTVENKIFILNIGAPFLCLQYAKEFKQTLPYVNILIGNLDESVQLAETLGCPNKEIKAIASYLHNECHKSKTIRTFVIITRGANPVILADENGVQEFEVPAIQLGRKFNTSGAGDYFVGGFLCGFVLNKSIQECVKSGILSSCELIEQNS